MTLAVAVVAGLLIGLSLGALGGGGSVLAVPVLVYAFGQSASQATTGSLVVVGVTSLVGAVTAGRAGHVLLGRGAAFGAVAVGGAALGAGLSSLVPDPVLTHPDWTLVALLTVAAVVGGYTGARLTARVDTRRLHTAFTALPLLVAGYTAWQAMTVLT